MNQTRFTSYDQTCYLSFTPLPELSSLSFDVEACVQGRKVTTNSMALTGTTQFLSELRAIESSWTGSATLTGTYDFCLIVSAVRPSVLWLSFSITDFITCLRTYDLPSMRHLLNAGFTVEEAPAHRLFSEFYELLDPLEGSSRTTVPVSPLRGLSSGPSNPSEGDKFSTLGSFGGGLLRSSIPSL